ncbi:MAG: hypothetical protein V4726_14560 [Verrucomicrobiota bacterium]
MSARKPLLVFSALLALSLAIGWRTGAASAFAGKSAASPGAGAAPAAEAAGSAVSGNPGSKGLSADGSVKEPSKPDAAAVKAELELMMKEEEENGEGGGAEMLSLWRVARIAWLFHQLTPEEKEALLAEVPKEDASELPMIMQSLEMFMGGKGKTADDYAKELGAMKKGATGMAQVTLLTWASNDPSGALQYWKSRISLPDPPSWVRENGGMLFGNISFLDPRTAVQEALSISDEKVRREMAGNINLHRLFSGRREDWPAEGTEIVRSLIQTAPEKQGSFLTGALAGRFAEESPPEVMSWIESLNLGPEAKAWTDESLLNAWWGKNQVEAANWRTSQTPPEKKAEVVEELVARWTLGKVSREQRERMPEPDLAGCADWILSLGIGPHTEKGISRLADGWIDAGEPAAALAWAQAIKNPEARQASLDNVSTQIRRRYPDTWRAMLTAAGLPAGNSEPAAPVPVSSSDPR